MTIIYVETKNIWGKVVERWCYETCETETKAKERAHEYCEFYCTNSYKVCSLEQAIELKVMNLPYYRQRFNFRELER